MDTTSTEQPKSLSLYETKKIAQICTYNRCTREPTDGSQLCVRHLAKQRKRDAKYKSKVRQERRDAGLCAFCAVKSDTYRCRACAIEAGFVASMKSVQSSVDKQARIAARTVANADGDGRTRYRGQTRKGQQTHAQLNVQDLGWARENFEAFAAGVTILGSEEAKAWRREERAQVTAATGNQAERACRHIDDILERLGHFKQRHGCRDGE